MPISHLGTVSDGKIQSLWDKTNKGAIPRSLKGGDARERRCRFFSLNTCFDGALKLQIEKRLMSLVVAAHALAASALIIAGVLTVRLVCALPSWLGVLVGLLLYALTLLLAKADDGDEEAP